MKQKNYKNDRFRITFIYCIKFWWRILTTSKSWLYFYRTVSIWNNPHEKVTNWYQNFSSKSELELFFSFFTKLHYTLVPPIIFSTKFSSKLPRKVPTCKIFIAYKITFSVRTKTLVHILTRTLFFDFVVLPHSFSEEIWLSQVQVETSKLSERYTQLLSAFTHVWRVI